MMTDLSQSRVLVTSTSFAKHDPRLREELAAAVGEVVYSPHPRPLTSAEVRDLLRDCDGFIAGLDVIDRAALEGANRLKVIARYGVGVDKVDLDAAREKGIRVTNTPGANSAAVAELTVGLMLSLMRQIPRAAESTRAGGWLRVSGVSLDGKNVGLLGFGAVGKEVARRLRGFGVTLLACDPFVDAATAHEYGATLVTQDDVITQSDVISLHLPVLDDTRAMVNEAFLARMKPGSYLINTARGELIDDDALLRALDDGRLAGAALDCFSIEPPDASSRLLAHERVIATPHIGAGTDGANNAMGWSALRNCLAVLRGEPPPNPVV